MLAEDIPEEIPTIRVGVIGYLRKAAYLRHNDSVAKDP